MRKLSPSLPNGRCTKMARVERVRGKGNRRRLRKTLFGSAPRINEAKWKAGYTGGRQNSDPGQGREEAEPNPLDLQANRKGDLTLSITVSHAQLTIRRGIWRTSSP